MHAVILFFWLVGFPDAGIHSQEFASKDKCIKAGIALKKASPQELTFMCVEK